MTRTIKYVNQKGELVFSEDGIVPDGCSVRVPLLLMDSFQRAIAVQSTPLLIDAWGAPAGHRPGYVFAPTSTNDARVTAYANESKRLQNAWRSPPGGIHEHRND